jgi:hypothetical protein
VPPKSGIPALTLSVESAFLARSRKSQKAPITFVMSVRLSAYINTASTKRISMKFGTADFYKKLLLHSKFDQACTKTWDTSVQFNVLGGTNLP